MKPKTAAYSTISSSASAHRDVREMSTTDYRKRDGKHTSNFSPPLVQTNQYLHESKPSSRHDEPTVGSKRGRVESHDIVPSTKNLPKQPLKSGAIKKASKLRSLSRSRSPSPIGRAGRYRKSISRYCVLLTLMYCTCDCGDDGCRSPTRRRRESTQINSRISSDVVRIDSRSTPEVAGAKVIVLFACYRIHAGPNHIFGFS